MLYLIQPDCSIRWNALSSGQVKGLIDGGFDLARLDWLPAEETAFSIDLLRAAVRHGIACSAGLAIDGGLVYELSHADQIAVTGMQADNSYAQLRESEMDKQVQDLIESQIPGWKTRSEQLDKDVFSSRQRAVQRARERAERILKAPVQPDLLEHWQYLGGPPLD